MTTKKQICDAFEAANERWAQGGGYFSIGHNCQTWANLMKAELKKTRTKKIVTDLA